VFLKEPQKTEILFLMALRPFENELCNNKSTHVLISVNPELHVPADIYLRICISGEVEDWHGPSYDQTQTLNTQTSTSQYMGLQKVVLVSI
jgi:hypothetical protein